MISLKLFLSISVQLGFLTASPPYSPTSDLGFQKLFNHEQVLRGFLKDVFNIPEKVVLTRPTFVQLNETGFSAAVNMLGLLTNGTRMILEIHAGNMPDFYKTMQYYVAKRNLEVYFAVNNEAMEAAGRGEEPPHKDLSLKNQQMYVIGIETKDLMFPDLPGCIFYHDMRCNITGPHHPVNKYAFMELGKCANLNYDGLKNNIERWCYFYRNAHLVGGNETVTKVASGGVMYIEKAYALFNFSKVVDEKPFFRAEGSLNY